MFSELPVASSSTKPNEEDESSYSDFTDEESMTSGLTKSSVLLLQMKQQQKVIDSLKKTDKA